jgi:hypothetical protein
MQAQSDWLEARYDFVEWRDVRAAEPGLVGIGFRFRGDELAGWQLHRTRNVRVAGLPPATYSIWTPAEGGSALVAVDVWECATAEFARAQLLRLLAEFQGPQLERIPSPGDVAFSFGSAAMLFARGNYAVQVRSVEREPVDAGPLAERFDRGLLTAPDTAVSGAGPLLGVSTSLSGPIRPGQRVPLDLDIDRTAGPVWIRLFTRAGRIRIEGGRPWYFAGPDGPADVAVVAVAESGAASRAVLRFEKEEL